MSQEALIIVDMSNDFIATDGSLTVGEAGQKIVPYVKDLADDFISKSHHVVVAMDAHQVDDDHFKLWPAHNVVGTKGQELYGELQDWFLANQDNELVTYLPKENYNSFFKTNLAELLKDKGVDTVHVVGVATDICVFNTVSAADAHGFKTKVHAKGVATFTDLGEIMLEHMTRCFHTEVIRN